MSRVLVTGGAGFIGSQLTDRLLAMGHEVMVVDDLSSGSLHNLAVAFSGSAALDFAQADVTTAQFASIVRAFRPRTMFHLAAQMDVRRSLADPVHDAMVNVVGTVRVLESCRHSGVEKVIFTTSGGCIYGEPGVRDLPVPEDHPGHPHSPYGAAKRGVEEYFHTYERLFGVRWTALALGNVYGPRQDPAGEAGVVSIFGGRMLAGERVTIYGDGEQSRDFVYIDDVVEGCVRSLTRGDGMRINIGTGQPISINTLFVTLAEILEYAEGPVHAPARAGELQHIALDCTRARRALGWGPTTPLRTGLGHTAEWLASSGPHSALRAG